jgi:hypothetical protein
VEQPSAQALQREQRRNGQPVNNSLALAGSRTLGCFKIGRQFASAGEGSTPAEHCRFYRARKRSDVLGLTRVAVRSSARP